jgi:glycolate oxidase
MVFPHGDVEAARTAERAAEEICRLALRLGGTITGEHGVGSLKRTWLHGEIDDDTYAVHRSIKSTLDPLGLLNPGKAI